MTEEFELRFLTARRNYIAGQFKELNDMQQQAVLTTEGPLLLLAGAGSGKTTVLIHRIANLLRFGCGSDSHEIPDTVTEEDVRFLEALQEPISEFDQRRADYLCAVRIPNPWNILAITFTNQAANELKNRLNAMLGSRSQHIWATTFHSACCRILRQHIDRLGYSKKFTIYDKTDSERVIKDIMREMGLGEEELSSKNVLSAISNEKNSNVNPNDILNHTCSEHYSPIHNFGRIYVKYHDRLRHSNALDFDDIILKTVELLLRDEDIRRYYQSKFRYILVDEYQDTNRLQYLLTYLLAGGHNNICVVGDDDQSIYRFRGATIENILNFERHYCGARVIRLEQNYRSTQAILNAANSVISHNIHRKGKRLWTAKGYGTPVVVYENTDEESEATYISRQIASRSNGIGFNRFAILYRTNAQARELEKALKSNTQYNPMGIPYRIIGGTRFYERAEIKDALAYLCVINNRSDNLRLKRIINNPPRGIGEKTLLPAYRLAEAEGIPIYSIISNPRSYAPIEQSAEKFRKFTDILDELTTLLESKITLSDFYEQVLIRTGYVDMLKKKQTEENQSRLENIYELKSSILSYEKDNKEPTLAGFLEEVALYTDIEEYHDGDDAVALMTMHASKGHEFPNVFLVGFEKDLFPSKSAIDDDEALEEERRLCYVAITRAMENLTITYARRRMLYGKTSDTVPSRFLKELPEGDIVRKGGYSTPARFASYGSTTTGGYQPAPVRTSFSSTPTVASKAPIIELNKGDMVVHAAFGRGLVLTVMKMSGDALLEIAFDQIGTKRLMAKSATPHLKKL